MICYKSIITVPRSLLTAPLLALAAAAAGAQGPRLEFSPRLPDTADPLVLALTDSFADCEVLTLLGPATVHGDRRITVPVARQDFQVLCIPGDTRSTLELPPLAAGTYAVELVDAGSLVLSRPLTVRAATGALELHDGRFQVSVTWRTPDGGRSGGGNATRLSEESGSFWFFDGANAEVTVKVLDGSAVNGHAWVFVASMTTVEFSVRVMDVGDGLCLMLPVFPPACPTRVYDQPPSQNRNFVDVEAFPWETPRSSAAAAGQPEPIRARIDPALPTTADEPTLHLAGISTCPGALEFQPPEVDGQRIVVRGTIATPCPDFGPFDTALALGGLAAGDYVVEATIDGGPPTTLAFAVTAPVAELALRGGGFLATLIPGEPQAASRTVALSDDSGYFWLYDAGNAEVTLKLLDGEAVNGHQWLFLASMTDRPFTLAVIDNRTGCHCPACASPPSCPTWSYVNPSGTTRNVIDVAAFD